MCSMVTAGHQHPGAFVKRLRPRKTDFWLASKCSVLHLLSSSKGAMLDSQQRRAFHGQAE